MGNPVGIPGAGTTGMDGTSAGLGTAGAGNSVAGDFGNSGMAGGSLNAAGAALTAVQTGSSVA